MARPRSTTTIERRDEFIRLLGAGMGWREACRVSRYDPGAVLSMLDALGVSAASLTFAPLQKRSGDERWAA